MIICWSASTSQPLPLYLSRGWLGIIIRLKHSDWCFLQEDYLHIFGVAYCTSWWKKMSAKKLPKHPLTEAVQLLHAWRLSVAPVAGAGCVAGPGVWDPLGTLEVSDYENHSPQFWMRQVPYSRNSLGWKENLFFMVFGLPGGALLENDGDHMNHKVLKFSAVFGACHHDSLS